MLQIVEEAIGRPDDRTSSWASWPCEPRLCSIGARTRSSGYHKQSGLWRSCLGRCVNMVIYDSKKCPRAKHHFGTGDMAFSAFRFTLRRGNDIGNDIDAAGKAHPRAHNPLCPASVRPRRLLAMDSALFEAQRAEQGQVCHNQSPDKARSPPFDVPSVSNQINSTTNFTLQQQWLPT